MIEIAGPKNLRETVAALGIRNQAFIDGDYVDAASGDSFDCVTPLTGEVITTIPSCDGVDVDRAVQGARSAFESGVWAQSAPKMRKSTLMRFADLLLRHQDELALLETIDMGKPINDARNSDIPAAATCLAYYGEAIDKLYGEVAPTDPQDVVMIVREPVGVVGAVVPWNYPLLLATWKLGPALATGNSVVLKPAEQSPLTALKLGELATEAGIPPGVLQIVPGLGDKAGQAIGRHPDVDAVAFTGSTEVGKLFLRYAGESNMKRITLECGGKSPQIVMPDCPDLDEAAQAVAWGVFSNQGEVCNAGSRVLIHEDVKDELLERVVRVGAAIQVGDPLEEETQMGPLVDRSHMERVLDYIAIGAREGATVRLGGNQTLTETGGFFVEPTVFDTVSNRMRIAQEEIFGPVLSTISFGDAEDAIRIANESVYGLAASIWTSDVNMAHRMSRALRAGIVWVNCFDRADISSPFGGFKQSGFGRDKSIHAIEKYTDLKAVWIHLT